MQYFFFYTPSVGNFPSSDYSGMVKCWETHPWLGAGVKLTPGSTRPAVYTIQGGPPKGKELLISV